MEIHLLVAYAWLHLRLCRATQLLRTPLLEGLFNERTWDTYIKRNGVRNFTPNWLPSCKRREYLAQNLHLEAWTRSLFTMFMTIYEGVCPVVLCSGSYKVRGTFWNTACFIYTPRALHTFPLDFLWGFLKQAVYRNNRCNLEGFSQRLQEIKSPSMIHSPTRHRTTWWEDFTPV